MPSSQIKPFISSVTITLSLLTILALLVVLHINKTKSGQLLTWLSLFEIISIMITTSILSGLAHYLPNAVSVGGLILTLACVLLGQGLIRDIVILAKHRKAHDSSKTISPFCCCIESSIGIVAIALGGTVFASGINAMLSIPIWGWPSLIFATLILGFICKDYILVFKPLAIRKDPNHLNIVLFKSR